MIVNNKLIIAVIIEVCGSITKVHGDVLVGSNKSECGEFGVDIGKMSLVDRGVDYDMRVMTKNALLNFSGHVGHAVLGNMAGSSATPADSFLLLCITLVIFFHASIQHTPSARMTTPVVRVQSRFLFKRVGQSRR